MNAFSTPLRVITASCCRRRPNSVAAVFIFHVSEPLPCFVNEISFAVFGIIFRWAKILTASDSHASTAQDSATALQRAQQARRLGARACQSAPKPHNFMNYLSRSGNFFGHLLQARRSSLATGCIRSCSVFVRSTQQTRVAQVRSRPRPC